MVQNFVSSPQLLHCIREALPADREQSYSSAQINSLYALATDQCERQIDCEIDLDHCILKYYEFSSKNITSSELPPFLVYLLRTNVFEKTK